MVIDEHFCQEEIVSLLCSYKKYIVTSQMFLQIMTNIDER